MKNDNSIKNNIYFKKLF